MRLPALGDFFWRTCGDQHPSLIAPLWPQVDEVIRSLDDIHVVFDDDHGVAGIDEALEHGEQAFNVGQVQAGGWLVEDVEGLPGVGAAQFRG